MSKRASSSCKEVNLSSTDVYYLIFSWVCQYRRRFKNVKSSVSTIMSQHTVYDSAYYMARCNLLTLWCSKCYRIEEWAFLNVDEPMRVDLEECEISPCSHPYSHCQVTRVTSCQLTLLTASSSTALSNHTLKFLIMTRFCCCHHKVTLKA